MAYDAKDERGNNPKQVLRRLGITSRPDYEGQGYTPGRMNNQEGQKINPQTDDLSPDRGGVFKGRR